MIIFLGIISASSYAMPAVRCESLLLIDFKKENKTSTVQNETQSWEQLYKKSDLSPRPEMWQKIRQSLAKRVPGPVGPLEQAGSNPDKIGNVYKSMFVEFPLLKTLLEVSRHKQISHADFIKLKKTAATQIIQVGYKSQSELQVFAALESLRLITLIESRVEFPKESIVKVTEENKNNEESTEQKKEAEKKNIQKKENKKPKEEEEESDKEEEKRKPRWNKTTNKYTPQNKDMSSGDGKGSNDITVDIAMTDAESIKGLLRQVIYDNFDLTKWESRPGMREPVIREKIFTKKIIIDPLGESEVEMPIPYGYTLVPGKYDNYEIKETTPGEFKLFTKSDEKIEVGLSKIINDPVGTVSDKRSYPELMNHWPKHLLTFTESLRGLPPIEAAKKLEKYIAHDGGFLYYSKGDKIDEKELKKIDEKMRVLQTYMPTPMAMANVGAFNCDGAAWIGGLLLRDVLGLKVRFVGGRTTGVKLIDKTSFNVARSSDPVHGWIEVHDGQRWIPIDMTPKNNVAAAGTAPADSEKEELKKEEQQQQQNNQNQAPKKTKPSDQKDEVEEQSENKGNDGKEDPNQKADNKDDKSEQKGKDDKKDDNESENNDSNQGLTKKSQELINSKAAKRNAENSRLSMIDKILRGNELVLLEHLIVDGYQSKYAGEALQILESFNNQPDWKAAAEKSNQKITSLLNESRFAKFIGLATLINEMKVEFGRNETRSARQKLLNAERLLLALADYRNLSRSEIEALGTIQKIISLLDQVKHVNAKEYELVAELLKKLPGNISKDWLKAQYGSDYDQLGSQANIALAQHIASGKLKTLLQMGAVKELVDIALTSNQDPHWKEEATLNRSYVPKPQQDLIITRNPLDFTKMLWDPRPGEHLFAPTIQGRQFAIGSLETQKVVSPQNPIEKKVSVVYYDISESMSNSEGRPMQVVDSLLLAFVDKALSEVDALGRPLHEIYLIPFNEEVLPPVHITSKEEAYSFIAKRMNYRSQAEKETNIQKVIEHFYDLVSTSYKTKSGQGREKLFQKANMVLITDGGSEINMNELETARTKIPSNVNVNMNFISIGDKVNEKIVELASSNKLSSKKPTFKHVDDQAVEHIAGIIPQYDPMSFATEQKLSGQMIHEINSLLQKLNVDSRLQGNPKQIEKTISEIQITKSDVRRISGLHEILILQKLVSQLDAMKINPAAKQRMVMTIIESYPQLVERDWNNMTYDEKEAFEKLKEWASR